MKNIIYALIDPITEEIKYVGKSTSGLYRPNQHKLKHNLEANTPKVLWIKELISNNLMYLIETIEELEKPEDLNNREIYWIKYLKEQGVGLLNSTEGGEGTVGNKLSEETKQLIRQKQKEHIKNNGPNPIFFEKYCKRKEHRIIDNIEYKHCSDCKSWKILEEGFHKNVSMVDRYKSTCKNCSSIRDREYSRKGKLTEEQWKQSYSDRNEQMREGVKNAYKNNPELAKNISKRNSKEVIGTCVNTGSVVEFESALKAKEKGFNNSYISSSIRSKKPYKGYYWKFKC